MNITAKRQAKSHTPGRLGCGIAVAVLWVLASGAAVPKIRAESTPAPRPGIAPGSGAAVDSIVYEADSVEDDLGEKRTVLTGNVVLHYRDVELRAGRIVYDRAARRLEAEPLPDSTGQMRVGLPVFIRGAERLTGTRMAYDLDTGRGQVVGGRASHQGKHYRGENILTNRQDELLARNLSMTTCDREHVHYDFACEDLKVVEDDKAIARSVTLRIGPVPVAWLPFYVFPLRTGRRSGLLTPRVGSNDRDGFFVSNLGYYIAHSDYWDLALRGTLRERGGFLLESRLVYAVRGRLDGAVDLGFDNTTTATRGSRNWRVGIQHRQRLSPTLNLRGNGQFTSSSDFDRRNTDNLFRYLNEQLRSSFSLDKQWVESRRSLDASVTYYRDLSRDRDSFQGFPRIAFRQGRRPFFAPSEGTSTTDRAWYQPVYYSLSGELANNFARRGSLFSVTWSNFVGDIETGILSESFRRAFKDHGISLSNDVTVTTEEAGREWKIADKGKTYVVRKSDETLDIYDPAQNTEDLTVGGLLSVNSQHRPFGWLDLSPAFSVRQTFSRNDQDSPTRREFYSAGVASGTTLYGIFHPHIGRLRGIRHRVSPRFDFRYTQAATVRGGTFGFGGDRTGGDPRRTLGMGLTNAFEIKTEVDGKERRSTFATVNLTTSYNFDATTSRWQLLRTSASIKPDRRVDIRMNMTHSFYDDDGVFSLLKPQLRSLSVTSNFRFRGQRGRTDVSDRELDRERPFTANDFGFERDRYTDMDDVTQPWRLGLTHYYDLRRFADTTQKRSWIKTDLGFNPTRHWRLNYSINYDLIPRRRAVTQNLSVYRDLHCWEASFSWYPTGFNTGFYFKINIKDIPQIRFEHGRGGLGL